MDSTTITDPVQEVLSRLKGVKPTAESSWEACCPSHDDGSPSLSVSRGEDGRALVYCHAGCTPDDICSAIGLKLADLFPSDRSPERANATKSAKPEAPAFFSIEAYSNSLGERCGGHWTYVDASGSPILHTVRINADDGKEFRQLHPVAGGVAFGGVKGKKLPLYRLPAIIDADTIYVFEGEKCADLAVTLGYATATTWTGGCNAVEKTGWSVAAGKHVIIFTDNDSGGERAGVRIATICAGLQPPAHVKIIRLPGLGEGEDIVNYVNVRECVDTEDIKRGIDELIEGTPWWVPSVDTVKLEPKAKPVRDVPAWEPFPLDTLPVEIREPVRTVAKAMSVAPSMIALPLLVVFAGAIGNSRRLQIKRGWYAPSILWAVIVAESGEVKTPAIQFAGRILYRRYNRAIREFAETQKRYDAELAEYNVKRKAEGHNCTMRKPQPPTLARCVISDATIEAIAVIHDENPRGLTLVRDELAAWFGSFNQYRSKGRGADIQHWEELHSGIGMIVDRKGGSGAPRQTTCIPRAAISITGGVQPGTLARILTPEFFESGLVARILFAMPPSKLRQWVSEEIPDGVDDQFDRIADRLFELQPEGDRDGNPQPKLLRFTDAALEKYINFHNEHCREQFNLHGDLKACWSKLEGYAGRLALVLHLTRWAAGESVDPDFVNGESVDNAVQLVRWFANEDRRVYGMVSEGFAGKEDRELVALIESRGGRMSVREIMRTTSRFDNAGGVEMSLNRLAKAGRGAWEYDDHDGGRGAPKSVFVLASKDTNT